MLESQSVFPMPFVLGGTTHGRSRPVGSSAVPRLPPPASIRAVSRERAPVDITPTAAQLTLHFRPRRPMARKKEPTRALDLFPDIRSASKRSLSGTDSTTSSRTSFHVDEFGDIVDERESLTSSGARRSTLLLRDEDEFDAYNPFPLQRKHNIPIVVEECWAPVVPATSRDSLRRTSTVLFGTARDSLPEKPNSAR